MGNSKSRRAERLADSRYPATTSTNADGQGVTWRHPGGKLLRMGPETLTDDELLAILIGEGSPGRTALEIAKDILDQYCSIYGLMGKPLEELVRFKGLKEKKAVLLAAAYELARRLVLHHQNWSDFKPIQVAPSSARAADSGGR